MVSSSTKSKPKPELPLVLTENMGGYITMANRFVAYLDHKEKPSDDYLVSLAVAISELRVEPGYATDYAAFMFRVSVCWSYRRMAEHFNSSEASMRRRVSRARSWILARVAQAAAA